MQFLPKSEDKVLAKLEMCNRGAVLSERGSVHQVRDRMRIKEYASLAKPKKFRRSLLVVGEAHDFSSKGAYVKYVTE